jgi:S-ribosylhomocysteine lyase LuxS involved in autoinducer biosynthesis
VYGRWGTEYSTQQLDTRIDLANEDHCGPCGNYSLEKTNEISAKKMNNTHSKNRKITTNEKYNSCSGDYFAVTNE